MVTLHYFFNYFVLLVLQSSVFVYAQESPIPPTTSQPEPSLSPINIENTLPQKTNDSLTSPDLTLQATSTNTNNTKANISNGNEFPKPSQVGTPVFYLNKTRETPLINLNAEKTFNTSANTKDGKDQTKCNMTLKTEDASKIDSEVPELLNSNETRKIEGSIEQTNEIQMSSILNDTNQNINNEVELIDDGQNTEEILRSPSHQEANAPGVPLVQGQLAAILAAVFVVISVVSYIALLSWRRYLENRYGDRQMLVNENELSDRDDLRHFSI